MPGRRRTRTRRREEEDLWFGIGDRLGTGRTFYLQWYWEMTAAKVARYVASELGAEVKIAMEVDGRPVIVPGNTMVCRPLPGRRTNHRPTNPYFYVVKRA